MGEMVARLVVGQEAFRPRRHPAHRTAEPPRRPGDERLLGIELALVAEAAAHIGRDHAQRALGHAELLGHLLADVVRRLRRAHERELAGAGLDGRERRPRLDRRADEAVVDEIDRDLVRRGLERGAHRRLVAARPAEADVAGRGLVQLRRAARLRGARVGDRRERLVVDGDALGGVGRRVARLRDHRRHRLADMADAAARQRVARRLRHLLSVTRADDPERPHRQHAVRRHVGAGEHRDDAGRGGCRRHVDRADAGMGMGRAHQHAVERARQLDVGDEFSAPEQEAPVLDPAQRRADALGLGRVLSWTNSCLRVPAERALSRESRDPGATRQAAPQHIALRDSCAGSRVSFRSAKTPRYSRPGHGITPSPRARGRAPRRRTCR